MIELNEKRSYNAKHFLKDDGKKVMQAHAGHIHYRGTDGVMKDVDFTLEDMGAYWQMVKASYKLLIAKDFGANQLISFQNKYRGANHEIIYEPKMLAWVNKTDLSDFQVFRNQQSVQGYIKDGNVIRYDNAFGDGLHFEITLLRSGFKKEIVIEAKNKLELPPTANHKLVALFQYTGTGLKIKSKDNLRQWTNGEYFEETDGFRVQEEANEIYQSFIRPAYIIDDGAETPTQENIKVFWKLHNGKLYQAKVLPTQFLKDAVYPVRADTTTSYYASSGNGRISASNASWSGVRALTTGTVTQTAQTTILQGSLYNGTYYLSHSFFPFNTADLPDDASISSASVYIYTLETTQNNATENIANASLVESTQASMTALAAADFDNLGTTRLADSDILISNWTGGYKSWSLNSSGIANISKTGYSGFALRPSNDYSDSTVPNDLSQGNAYLIAESGTDKDPYLEITYTEGGGGATWTPKIIMY